MKTGKTLRDEGIRLVLDNTAPSWRDEALAVVEHLANTRDFFTSDDVWENLASAPENPAAMGGVMHTARKLHMISPTNDFVLTKRRSGHARPIRVWAGLA